MVTWVVCCISVSVYRQKDSTDASLWPLGKTIIWEVIKYEKTLKQYASRCECETMHAPLNLDVNVYNIKRG